MIDHPRVRWRSVRTRLPCVPGRASPSHDLTTEPPHQLSSSHLLLAETINNPPLIHGFCS